MGVDPKAGLVLGLMELRGCSPRGRGNPLGPAVSPASEGTPPHHIHAGSLMAKPSPLYMEQSTVSTYRAGKLSWCPGCLGCGSHLRALTLESPQPPGNPCRHAGFAGVQMTLVGRGSRGSASDKLLVSL